MQRSLCQTCHFINNGINIPQLHIQHMDIFYCQDYVTSYTNTKHPTNGIDPDLVTAPSPLHSMHFVPQPLYIGLKGQYDKNRTKGPKVSLRSQKNSISQSNLYM